MYNVGQADNLLNTGMGSVSMPNYTNACPSPDQYPCNYSNIDLSRKPEQIHPGINENRTYEEDQNNTYPKKNYYKKDYKKDYKEDYKEDYVENTQHKQAGDIEDKHLFLIMFILLLIGIMLFFINIKYLK
jgi:hypothetical protein